MESPTYRGTSRNTSTVNRYMSSLSGALRYASRNLRWIDDNPCANLLKLKEKPKERRILSENEVIRLLEACKKSRNCYLYCITLIALTTGARKGEIVSLSWDCIDFDNQIALIKDSKNGKPRRIGLVNSVVQELCQLHKNRNLSNHLCLPARPLLYLDIKKAWESVLKKTGIEDFVFHGLRHHFASIGGQIGATGVQLRAQLGHSTSSMTDHYSHFEAHSTKFIGEYIEQRIENVRKQ